MEAPALPRGQSGRLRRADGHPDAPRAAAVLALLALVAAGPAAPGTEVLARVVRVGLRLVAGYHRLALLLFALAHSWPSSSSGIAASRSCVPTLRGTPTSRPGSFKASASVVPNTPRDR